MTTINPGDLKSPIVIQSPSTTKDEFGQPTSTWTDVQSTWASIHTATSKEIYALGAGFNSQISHAITILFNPAIAIAAGMRVCYMSRHFVIQTVNDPAEDRVILNLMCLEQTK
ncbi:phage head closure protein [Granulicella mallensis]|uniref:SPP1 family predicted phage head-tail adaptor n=1 Tax=Granulicella mallensis TaxID=940614 RepID=A0A7W7ZUT1_9BACT|nr:phage head closure protein [Granulicella mallensis]MBB5066147.1 SPP1 family predicted phage head-tail adaptor [Granulicella mallensis]